MRVAITGGPGVGKTTLVEALARLGFRTVSESARDVIRERLACGLTPRPDAATFAREVLRRDIAKYRAAVAWRGPVFFDRTAVESLAMVHEASSLSDKERDRVLSTCRFHSAALVLPPWRAIYVTDTERDQTFQDAQRIDARIRTCYREAGFSLLDVPSLPVQERAVFVLRSLGIADI